jgi:uncharacterized protein
MILKLSEIDESPLRLEQSLELAGPRAADGSRLVPGRASLVGEVRRGTAGVELRARWEATLRLQCSRCLETFELAAGEDFFLILTPAATEFGAQEQEMQAEDACLFHVEGEAAQLAEVVAEQIQLYLPLKPICREDCAGLCQTCGADRNRVECGCRRVEVDPRLAPLLAMKDRFGKG